MNENKRFTPETGPKKITLNEVIDSAREVPTAYKKLILEQERRNVYLHQEFSEHWSPLVREEWRDEFPVARALLKERLAGSLLVDLGAGRGSSSWIARAFGVTTYIS